MARLETQDGSSFITPVTTLEHGEHYAKYLLFFSVEELGDCLSGARC